MATESNEWHESGREPMSRKQQKLDGFSMPVTETGCHLWFGASDPHGYGRVRLDGKTVLAHRTAWEVSEGPIPRGLCVLHKCDTPACINPAHLFLGTQADNAGDRERKGRGNQARGERHCRAKLTAQQVLEIRACDERQLVIARRYGVSPQHVSSIKSGARRSVLA